MAMRAFTAAGARGGCVLFHERFGSGNGGRRFGRKASIWCTNWLTATVQWRNASSRAFSTGRIRTPVASNLETSRTQLDRRVLAPKA